MGAAELLQQLRTGDFEIRIDDDSLVISPFSRLQPNLIDQIRGHKPEIMALLENERNDITLLRFHQSEGANNPSIAFLPGKIVDQGRSAKEVSPLNPSGAHYCWHLRWPYGHSETEVTIPARTVKQMTANRSMVRYEPFIPEKPQNPAPQDIQRALVELVYAGKLTDDECDFVCDYWNCWPEQDWNCRWLGHLKEYWH